MCDRAHPPLALCRSTFPAAAWHHPRAIVLDAGVHAEGKRVSGDVEAGAAAARAAWLTPIPGGIGPLTVTCLLENTVLSAERRSV